jgi:hypothetical protein
MYHRLAYVSGGIFGRLDILYETFICIRRCIALQYSCTLYIPTERHHDNQSIIPPILFSYNL